MKTIMRLILKPFIYLAYIMDEIMDEDLERSKSNEEHNRRA